MVIRFACRCGKRLGAPRKMAGRQTTCPVCGNSIEIPFRSGRMAAPCKSPDHPAETETYGTVDPGESPVPRAARAGRQASNRRDGLAAGTSTFVAVRGVGDGDPLITLRRQPRWMKLLPPRKPPRWYSGLSAPFTNVPVFLRLGFVLTALTGIALASWVSIDPDGSPLPREFLIASCAALAFVLGYVFNYFNALLSLSAEGKSNQEPTLDAGPLGAILSCAHWLGCFLAGPVLFFAAAALYWIYCGELAFFDWMILVELVFVGVGWWIVSLVITNVDDTIWVPNPIRVVRVGFGMGLKWLELTALAMGIFIAHLGAVLFGIAELHQKPVLAVPLLCACWTSVLYFGAFACRRIGTSYRSIKPRRSSKRDTPREQACPPDIAAGPIRIATRGRSGGGAPPGWARGRGTR